MAASTDLTPGVLGYTTALSTSAATSIYAGPSTAQRALVTACYVTNRSTSDQTVTLTHRMSTTPNDVDLLGGTTIEANKTALFGPWVMSSTTSQQSIVGNASTGTAIQIALYGYLENI